MELRTSIHGAEVTRDRVADVIDAHKQSFTVVERTLVRERRHLDGDHLRDLLRSSYRGARSSAAARVEHLSSMDVTLASDFVLLARRE